MGCNGVNGLLMGYNWLQWVIMGYTGLLMAYNGLLMGYNGS